VKIQATHTLVMRSDDAAVCHVMLLHYTVNYKYTRQLLHLQMEHLQHTWRGFAPLLQTSDDISSTNIHYYFTINPKQILQNMHLRVAVYTQTIDRQIFRNMFFLLLHKQGPHSHCIQHHFHYNCPCRDAYSHDNYLSFC